MRYPKFLPENGTIGFVAPSFGASTEPYISLFDSSLKKLKNLGFNVQEGPNCRLGEGIGISNTPKKCGDEINSMYADKDNDVLLSVGGGELMCEVIPYMDFDLVKKSEPKWYMGYSDNTNFTLLSATIADTAAIYGPCASSFGMEPWHESIMDALNIFTGKNLTVHGYDMWEGDEAEDADTSRSILRETNPLIPYMPNKKTEYKYYLPDGKSIDRASFSGRLLGGCLDCLVNIAGTRFDHVKEFNEKYKEDGVIWFLEACELNVMSIRRSLWNLKNAGWFDSAKGFLIGRPYFYGQDMMGLDQYSAVTGILSDLNVPIIMDLDIGHRPPMMPLITGALANVKADGNEIEIEHILR